MSNNEETIKTIQSKIKQIGKDSIKNVLTVISILITLIIIYIGGKSKTSLDLSFNMASMEGVEPIFFAGSISFQYCLIVCKHFTNLIYNVLNVVDNDPKSEYTIKVKIESNTGEVDSLKNTIIKSLGIPVIYVFFISLAFYFSNSVQRITNVFGMSNTSNFALNIFVSLLAGLSVLFIIFYLISVIGYIWNLFRLIGGHFNTLNKMTGNKGGLENGFVFLSGAFILLLLILLLIMQVGGKLQHIYVPPSMQNPSEISCKSFTWIYFLGIAFFIPFLASGAQLIQVIINAVKTKKDLFSDDNLFNIFKYGLAFILFIIIIMIIKIVWSLFQEIKNTL